MSLSQDALALLECIEEPAVLVEPAGRVLGTNRAVRLLLGDGLAGGDLVQHVAGPPQAFSDYLRRCFGTSEALPGAVTLHRSDQTDGRYKISGARLRTSDPGGPAKALLRLSPSETDGFSVLAQQVSALNSEVRQRRRAQATLQEAVRRNETLLQELQHRVKNNMQMLLGLFAAAKRETDHAEVRTFLQDIAERLAAVVTAQQLMYRSQQLEAVDASAFVTDLCKTISRSYGEDVRLEISSFEGTIANDVVFPLALILNELLTNAYKYGLQGQEDRLLVDLRCCETGYTLLVQDNGPGMTSGPPERRSSGLGLVRGLCRQIGGSLVIENDGGTRCIVHFRRPG